MFVDTHVHFHDLANPELVYPQFRPGASHPRLGSLDTVASTRFDAVAYCAESRFSDVKQVVAVHTALGTEDPVRETAWLDGMAARDGVPHAIVAHCDLSERGVDRTIERHAVASGRFRGVRDVQAAHRLREQSWRRGVSVVVDGGYVLEVYLGFESLEDLRDLALAFPEGTIVIHTKCAGRALRQFVRTLAFGAEVRGRSRERVLQDLRIGHG